MDIKMETMDTGDYSREKGGKMVRVEKVAIKYYAHYLGDGYTKI